jgi:hypothetical protein
MTMGFEIIKKESPIWWQISLLSVAGAVIGGIWVGPVGIYVLSSLGLLSGLWGLFRKRKQPLLIILSCVHGVFLIIGLTLDALFLQPLSSESLHMPRLTQTFKNSTNFFEIRTPLGWTTEEIHAATELGVRIRPSSRQEYMGVSELTVRIRELENPKSLGPNFLKKMAETLSTQRDGGPKLFEFSTDPAQLLSGDHGMWSRLVVKRFWIPIYQLALFGIKEKRYLCSVSATGLKTHATLSEVLCLGIFETIQIKGREN